MDLLLREKCENCTEEITQIFIKLNEPQSFNQDVLIDTINIDSITELFKRIGWLFYLVKPQETKFELVEDVPNFYQNAWPYFLLFMLLENLILWFDRKPTYRLNDSLTSLSHGLIQQCGRLIFRGSESYAYIFIYENLRLFELPWNSTATWYFAAIGVDFCYYWVHRACHEVHILWAQHQVHHSSEEFNMAVGLRQSFLHGWCGFIFYLPLAFVLPPAQFVTHQQFNLLYQFWIHTKTVKTLGPLEYIFNTPQHHRVHHGSNIYCLDKNYGGVLIIWDRLFGTFATERRDEEIVYGLVFNQPSFNVLHLQTFYTAYVIQRFNEMKCWPHKLAAIFWGPSWQPGKPRLGLDEDKVKVVPRPMYDVKLPWWCNIYLFVHFCFVVYGFQELSTIYMHINPLVVLVFVVYIIASLTSIGLLFDDKPYASLLEVVRCLLLVTAIQRSDFKDSSSSEVLIVEVFYTLSGLFWFLQSIKIIQLSQTSKKTV